MNWGALREGGPSREFAQNSLVRVQMAAMSADACDRAPMHALRRTGFTFPTTADLH